MNGEEESKEPLSPFLENASPRLLSSGEGVELTSEVSVSTNKRRKPTEPDVAEEQTKAHSLLQRGHGRRKAAEANEVNTKGTLKI